MLTRRLVFRALFAGLGALARPAAMAAQPPVLLPLRDAHALVVVDAWEGYSPVLASCEVQLYALQPQP